MVGPAAGKPPTPRFSLNLVEDIESKSVASVERAADVLLHFAADDRVDLGVTDIANDLGISKAAVHRVLTSLRTRGLVVVDEVSRRYSLGPNALLLGLSALNRLDVRRLAAAELPAMSADTGETATLSVRNGFGRVYVDQVTPNREVIMSVSIGVLYPLHAGSSSKAFLAFLSESEISQYLAQPLNELTPSTLTSRRALQRDLKEIAARGWAQSIGERQSGAASVAAPVFNHLGQPAAVLSLCGPAERFVPEVPQYVKRLLEASARLSGKLGYRPVRS
jgi:IclR family acetate operon transcriptional repressor